MLESTVTLYVVVDALKFILPVLSDKVAKLLFALLTSFLVIFKVYIFFVPFSLVTVILNVFFPYASVFVPIPVTVAVLSLFVTLIETLSLLDVISYDVLSLLKPVIVTLSVFKSDNVLSSL